VDKILRYKTTIDRQLYRAITELEKLQAARGARRRPVESPDVAGLTQPEVGPTDTTFFTKQSTGTDASHAGVCTSTRRPSAPKWRRASSSRARADRLGRRPVYVRGRPAGGAWTPQARRRLPTWAKRSPSCGAGSRLDRHEQPERCTNSQSDAP